MSYVTNQQLQAALKASNQELLKGLNQRFDTLDGRFDTLDGRFDTLDSRFDTLDSRFDRLEKRFDTLEAMMNGAKEVTETIADNMATHGDITELANKLDKQISSDKAFRHVLLQAAGA